VAGARCRHHGRLSQECVRPDDVRHRSHCRGRIHVGGWSSRQQHCRLGRIHMAGTGIGTYRWVCLRPARSQRPTHCWWRVHHCRGRSRSSSRRLERSSMDRAARHIQWIGARLYHRRRAACGRRRVFAFHPPIWASPDGTRVLGCSLLRSQYKVAHVHSRHFTGNWSSEALSRRSGLLSIHPTSIAATLLVGARPGFRGLPCSPHLKA
jgi:hypothetical protein